MRKWIVIFFLIPFLCNAQDTLYMSTTGDDSNPGTLAQPFATLQKLVNEVEADFKARKISTVSPIGKSLLGKSVGDTVEITIPKGTLRYKITKISR